MKKIRWFSTLFLFLFVVSLSGCVPMASVDASLQFQEEEKWKVEVLAAFFTQDAALNHETIVQTLEQIVQGLNAQGLKGAWSQDPTRGAVGSMVYVVTVEGQGFEPLNRLVLQQPGAVSLSQSGNQKAVLISMSPQLGLEGVPTVRYTLSGGEILATNGITFDQKTVYWLNPNGKMELTLLEPNGFSWFGLGLLLAGLVLMGISAFGLFSLQKKKPVEIHDLDTQPSRVLAPSMKVCVNCQAEIPQQAIFCPNCGKPQSQPG